MEEQPTQLRKGALELAVLAILSSGPRYGVELVAELAARRGLDAGSGTIYPLLTRLKKSGLVATTWQESPVGPPRKYYTLSNAGRQQLASQLLAWSHLVSAMTQLLEENGDD